METKFLKYVNRLHKNDVNDKSKKGESSQPSIDKC